MDNDKIEIEICMGSHEEGFNHYGYFTLEDALKEIAKIIVYRKITINRDNPYFN